MSAAAANLPKQIPTTCNNDGTKLLLLNKWHRQRCAKCCQKTEGNPCGAGVGFDKNVLPSEALEMGLKIEELPVAMGTFIGIHADFKGAKVA